MTQNTSTETRRRWILWRRLGLAILLIAATYGLFCLLYLWHQTRNLFPGRKTQGLARCVVPPSPDYELVHITTANGDRITAVFGKALDADDHVRPDAASRPTIIYFNGNGSTVSGVMTEFRSFRRLGCNAIIHDYPGYGMSGGRASERSLYACADGVFDYLCHRSDIDPTQIVSCGWSLGSAVATDLAAHRPVMGLVALSVFTSWKKELNEKSHWLLASFWLQAGLDNEAKFATLRCPVFIAHGKHDGIIPFSMAQRLGEVLGGVVPMPIDAGHELFNSHRDEVMSAIGRFIDACAASRKAPNQDRKSS